MARHPESGGEGLPRQFSSFNAGAEGSIPPRVRIVSPNTTASSDLPTAFVSKRGEPKTVRSLNQTGSTGSENTGSQGPLSRAVVRGVEAVQRWREGRRGTTDATSVAKPAEATTRPHVDDAKAEPLHGISPTAEGGTPHPTRDTAQRPHVDDAITEEIPVVPAITTEEERYAAEDESMVKTIDWLMTKASQGDKKALDTAGRLMSLAELRGRGLVGRIERLANTVDAPPATEPTEQDLVRIDEICRTFDNLSISEQAGLIDLYGSDFDASQLQGVRGFVSDSIHKKRAARRLKQLRDDM